MSKPNLDATTQPKESKMPDKRDTLSDACARLPEFVNGNSWLVNKGQLLDINILIEIGDIAYYVTIQRGRIEACVRNPLPLRPWEFAVRGTLEGWHGFWQPIPPPQFHDIFALIKRGEFRIEGNLQRLMANLFYFKDVLAAPRGYVGS
jgi:hypothetical protein